MTIPQDLPSTSDPVPRQRIDPRTGVMEKARSGRQPTVITRLDNRRPDAAEKFTRDESIRDPLWLIAAAMAVFFGFMAFMIALA